MLIEVEPDTPKSVRISIHDTGVGIPKDKIGGVFGAFTQADQVHHPQVRRHGARAGHLQAAGRRHGRPLPCEQRSGLSARPSPSGLPIEALEPATALAPAAPVRREGAAGLRRPRHPPGHWGAICRAEATAWPSRARSRCSSSATPRPCARRLGARRRASVWPPMETRRPHELQRAGLAQAVLIQPFRRRDLERIAVSAAGGRGAARSAGRRGREPGRVTRCRPSWARACWWPTTAQ